MRQVSRISSPCARSGFSTWTRPLRGSLRGKASCFQAVSADGRPSFRPGDVISHNSVRQLLDQFEYRIAAWLD